MTRSHSVHSLTVLDQRSDASSSTIDVAGLRTDLTAAIGGEVRFESEVVAGGDDGAGQTIGVHRRHLREGAGAVVAKAAAQARAGGAKSQAASMPANTASS